MIDCRILMADDDPEDRSIIHDAMEYSAAGGVMQFAENGAQALKMLDEFYENAVLPKLVVLDLNMPKMNGIEALTAIKDDDRFRHIPVIIYSTSINPADQKKCMQLGASAYVSKPISFAESIKTARVFLQLCSAEAGG